MASKLPARQELVRHIEELTSRLEEAEGTLRAIQAGEVDALVISKPDGEDAIYTLKSAEQPYRVMVETMSEGACTLAPDGNILYCNARFAEWVGLPLEQVIGQLVQVFVTSEDLPVLARLLESSLTEYGRQEIRLQGVTGVQRPTYFSTQPLCLEELRVICAVVTDLTDMVAAAETVRRANDELEQRVTERTAELEAANKELEAFIYSVSHDLRAPLRAIDGFSRMLIQEHQQALSPEVQRLAGVIRVNSARMAELINDLLSFSRLSRQPIQKPPVDMAVLVNQSLQDLEEERKGRSVEIVLGDLPACQGDWMLLKQVWINLLSNALKYTRQRDPAHIEIASSQPDGDKPVYYVRDNGVGFDMAYAGKLFGVFQRLHSADEYEGTGVGLAIVQRIIQRHGGRVWAEGAVDKGATFYFTL